MHPILASFEIGGTAAAVPAYGTFLVLASVAALLVGAKGAASLGVRPEVALAGLTGATLAALAGARLLDVALNADWYAADPVRTLAIEPRGLALYGGLLAGLVAAAVLARRWGIPFAALADRSIAAVVAGIVLVRIGCFLNGCCAGSPTDLPWGVVFPPRDGGVSREVLGGLGVFGAVVPDASVAVHPTQLYEIVAAVACGVVGIAVARRGAPPGVGALTFVAGFLAFRAADQILRAPSPASSVAPDTIVAGYAAAAVVAVAVLAACVRRPRGRIAVAPGAGTGRPAAAVRSSAP